MKHKPWMISQRGYFALWLAPVLLGIPAARQWWNLLTMGYLPRANVSYVWPEDASTIVTLLTFYTSAPILSVIMLRRAVKKGEIVVRR